MTTFVSGATKIRDMRMSKDISITALATDKEIDQLWYIAWEILDRNNLDDDGELSIVVRNRE